MSLVTLPTAPQSSAVAGGVKTTARTRKARAKAGARMMRAEAGRSSYRYRERLRAAGIPVERAPRRWERIGDVLVLRFPPGEPREAPTIAKIFGTVLRARTVVQDVSGIHGPLRVPDVRLLWGNGTETVHVEGGIRYALDVARVMFSSGNLAERTGIADRVRPAAPGAPVSGRPAPQARNRRTGPLAGRPRDSHPDCEVVRPGNRPLPSRSGGYTPESTVTDRNTEEG